GKSATARGRIAAGLARLASTPGYRGLDYCPTLCRASGQCGDGRLDLPTEDVARGVGILRLSGGLAGIPPNERPPLVCGRRGPVCLLAAGEDVRRGHAGGVAVSGVVARRADN